MSHVENNSLFDDAQCNYYIKRISNWCTHCRLFKKKNPVINCFLLDSVLMCGLFVCKLDRNSVCARARVCVSEEHQIESRLEESDKSAGAFYR